MSRKGVWAKTEGAIRRQTTKAWWGKDAPIHWPVKADGTPAYKVTIAPKPGDPLKTNTHGEHG